MPETPEQLACQQIDAMLIASGWVIQDYKGVGDRRGLGAALEQVATIAEDLKR